MKTNIKVKDEPVEFQNYTNETVNELLRLYRYHLPGQSSSTSTKQTQEQEPSTCAWCQKLGVRSFTLRTDSGDSKALCSEVCFNQYRRASFKKNKGSECESSSVDSTRPVINKSKVERRKMPLDLLDQHQNRRKLLLPLRHTTPPTRLPKRHRVSSSTDESSIPRLNSTSATSTLPSLSLTWPSPFLNPEVNQFQYPFYPPAPPQSTLFSSLMKGTLSNITCILPTFIPLPIPIPIPIPIPLKFPSPHQSCAKCSVEVNDQHCQTDDEQFSRRMSV